MWQRVKTHLDGAPILFLILAMAFTGANVPVGKMIVEDMPVFLFLGVRFAVATLALWWLMRPRDWQTLSDNRRHDQGGILILAGVGSVLFTLFLLEGTKRTTASEAGIISATLPAVVALLAVAVLRHRITARGTATIALSVLGLVVIQFAGPLTSAGPAAGADAPPFHLTALVGNGLVLAAVVCEAVFVLRSRDITARLSPVALSFAVSATSLVLALPLIIIEVYALGLATYGAIPAATWGLAAWYGLTASVFCTILWYAGVGRVASWQAGLATTAIPIAAIAVAALLLGEVLTLGQTVGAGLVIAAIVIGALARDHGGGTKRAPVAVHASTIDEAATAEANAALTDRPVDAPAARPSDGIVKDA